LSRLQKTVVLGTSYIIRKGSATIWNLKPEWWVSTFVQENYQENKNLWQKMMMIMMIIIIIIIIITRLRSGWPDFDSRHNFQTKSGAHTASYPMGTGVPLYG
jgi:hypothetical protein